MGTPPTGADTVEFVDEAFEPPEVQRWSEWPQDD